MTAWYNKYKDFPYLHLGNNAETGIDCFNLCKLVYLNELEIDFPYTTSDFCKIVDEDWYSKTQERFFEINANKFKHFLIVFSYYIFFLIKIFCVFSNLCLC